MSRPRQAPECAALLRDARQLIERMAHAQEQRDRQVAEQIARLDRKLSELIERMAQQEIDG